MSRKRSRVSLRDLIEAELITPGQVLLFKESRDTQARITMYGTVVFRGTEYNTLSEAARAVTGNQVNGWRWWSVKSPDGTLTRLGDLRKGLGSES